MRYAIRAPQREYQGETAGIRFTAGRAEVDDPTAAQLAYFRRRGYRVSEVDSDQPRPDDSVQPAEVGGTGEPAGTEPDDGQLHLDNPAARFDPAEHDAAAVLAEIGRADEAEATRILDAEQAGKARKGIVNQRDTLIEQARERAGGGPQ